MITRGFLFSLGLPGERNRIRHSHQKKKREKVTKACEVICVVIAPKDGEKLLKNFSLSVYSYSLREPLKLMVLISGRELSIELPDFQLPA